MAYDHNTFDSEMDSEREKTFYLRESFARLLNELIEEAVKKADYLKLKAHFKEED